MQMSGGGSAIAHQYAALPAAAGGDAPFGRAGRVLTAYEAQPGEHMAAVALVQGGQRPRAWDWGTIPGLNR